jgi:response regulator RpfG family c-di-GMP phosphodiesterase
LLVKPFFSLSERERIEVAKHPLKGQIALMALEQLHGAAQLIRSHHERFDGLGYPDMLAGPAIPLGARILALANDYDAAQIGTLLPKQLTQNEAVAFIQKWRGTRYDPAVVDAFMYVLGRGDELVKPKQEVALNSRHIKTGMVISRDIVANNGDLLLPKGCILNEHLIEQLQSFERMGGNILSIHIRV